MTFKDVETIVRINADHGDRAVEIRQTGPFRYAIRVPGASNAELSRIRAALREGLPTIVLVEVGT